MLYTMPMSRASTLLRDCRITAGITQTELGARLGISQPAVAALERPSANPTARSLERTLNACGRTLATAERRLPDVDEAQIRARLAMSPAQRLATFQRSHHNLNELLRKATRVVPPA